VGQREAKAQRQGHWKRAWFTGCAVDRQVPNARSRCQIRRQFVHPLLPGLLQRDEHELLDAFAEEQP
jgi:hypothetical protein